MCASRPAPFPPFVVAGRILAAALALLSGAGFPAAGAAGAAGAGGGPAVRFEVRQATGERVLTVESPPVAWAEVEGAFEPSLPGFGRVGQVGLPDLPARLERVALPPGGELEILDVEAEWSEGLLPGPLAPYPARDPFRAADPAGWPAGAGWWPEEPVRLARQDGAWRTLRFAELEIVPLQVAPGSGRFRVATRLTIRLRVVDDPRGTRAWSASAAAIADDALDPAAGGFAHGAALVPRADLPSLLQASAPAAASTPLAPLAAPTYPAWQVLVNADGLQRITYEWAQANAPGLLSFLTSNDPRRYRLSVQGVQVPIRVAGETDGVFGPGDAIVFYGQAVGRVDLFEPDVWQKGDYTDVNVYRLDTATGPLRVAESSFTGAPNGSYSVPPSFRDTVHHEEDEKFQGFVPIDGVDHWYVDPFLDANGAPVSLDQLVPTPDHAGGSVSLRTRLLGFQYNRNYHRSEVS
ncbi:MAG: hypothetical protein MUC67_10320, partial [Acidobacteria bacterium]|nr:hypothetical protein [Acidobacteriota bacterium]